MRVDLAKLWVIEVFIIADAIYANTQQQKMTLCTPTGTPRTAPVQGWFTGTLAHMVCPWLIGGALLVGALMHILRR